MSNSENLRFVRQFIGFAGIFLMMLSLYGCAGFGKDPGTAKDQPGQYQGLARVSYLSRG